MEFEIRVATDDRDLEAVRVLWAEYWRSLGLPPGFQRFADEVRSLPGSYGPPTGKLIIAWHGHEPAGTIALRRLAESVCEAKRLFVRLKFRRQGLGRALLDRIIADARAMGYRMVYADSLLSMKDAQALYRGYGFNEVEPYSAEPTPGAIYLGLRLDSN